MCFVYIGLICMPGAAHLSDEEDQLIQSHTQAHTYLLFTLLFRLHREMQ